MKKIIVVIVGFLMGIVSTNAALAQDAHIVHYDANPKEKSKRPDFSKAIIGIQFGGAPAVTAKKLMMDLGARDFNEASSPCNINQDIICVTAITGSGQAVSGYGSSGGYGSRGGGYSSGSFSGVNYPITIRVSLIEYNNGGTKKDHCPWRIPGPRPRRNRIRINIQLRPRK